MKPLRSPLPQIPARTNSNHYKPNQQPKVTRSNSQNKRPVTQEEIRSALTLLKSKRQRVTQVEFRPEPIINKPPQQQYAEEDDDEPLEECPEGCGRKFKSQALIKHMKICKKVFQQQRKKFDTKEQRIIGQDHAKILHEVEIKEQIQQKREIHLQKKQSLDNRPIQGQKKPKWKAQSDAFRAMLKVNKGAEMTQEEKIAFEQIVQDDRVQCEYCGRKFNPETAKKHIPSCQQKAKVNSIKNGTLKKQSSIPRKY